MTLYAGYYFKYVIRPQYFSGRFPIHSNSFRICENEFYAMVPRSIPTIVTLVLIWLFLVFSEMSRQLLDGLPLNAMHMFVSHPRMNSKTLSIPQLFQLAPSSGQHLSNTLVLTWKNLWHQPQLYFSYNTTKLKMTMLHILPAKLQHESFVIVSILV